MTGDTRRTAGAVTQWRQIKPPYLRAGDRIMLQAGQWRDDLSRRGKSPIDAVVAEIGAAARLTDGRTWIRVELVPPDSTTVAGEWPVILVPILTRPVPR